jgi:hypothetical protein
MRQLWKNRTVRWLVEMVVLICLLGAAFYGGRVYQNNADQSLFNQYNPKAQTGNAAGGRNFSFTGGSSTSLVSQALSVGTPPPLTPVAASTAATPGTAASPGSSGGSPSANGAANAIGTLQSISQTALTIQSFQGTSVTARVTTRSRFYAATSAARSTLATGQHVAIGLDFADPSSTAATSVTISPAGAPYASVRVFGGGGSGGGFGGRSGGGNAGGGGAGGTPGSGRFVAFTEPTGTLVKVSGTSLTLQTSAGVKTFSLSSSTQVYQLSPLPISKMQTGVRTAVSLQGQGNAAVVVAAAQPSGSGFVTFVS